MSKVYYKKTNNRPVRTVMHFFGLSAFLFGFVSLLYFFFPLLSWQFFLEPAIASQNIATPVAGNAERADSHTLLATTVEKMSGADFTDAANWYPRYKGEVTDKPKVTSFTLSIPKLNVINATVVTTDTKLADHLVNYPGTAVPPAKGNAVIFGHSTIPQFFNPNDYRTIFATLHTLRQHNKVLIGTQNRLYTYDVKNILVVDPTDMSVFDQEYDASYLTLVTCTPPGTTWKRLVIIAKLTEG